MGIDLNTILEQAKTSQKAMDELLIQNRTFDTIIQEAIKGAPEKDKPIIEKVRQLSVKATNLAKQGKIEEAQNLIKSFSDGD